MPATIQTAAASYSLTAAGPTRPAKAKPSLSPTAVAQLRRWIEVATIDRGQGGTPRRAPPGTGGCSHHQEAGPQDRASGRSAVRPFVAGRRGAGPGDGGADVAGLMQAGKWKPMQMLARYSERLEPKRDVVAQLRHTLNQVRR